MQILTVLPQSWSDKKIENEFGVSNYMAQESKELVKEKGTLFTPNPTRNCPFSHSILRV